METPVDEIRAALVYDGLKKGKANEVRNDIFY